MGTAVSGISDVNADGIDDILVSKEGSNLDGTDSTELRAYVLFGRNTLADGDFPSSFNVTEIDGWNGFSIGSGNSAPQQTGIMNVSGGVDINADGIDDIVLGEPWFHLDDSRR